MELVGKSLRRVNNALAVIYTPTGIRPVEFRPGTVTPRDFFSRTLQLSGHRLLQFTDLGFQEFKEIVKQIHALQIFGENASYGDTWGATYKVIESLLSDDLMPEDGNELVQLVRERLEPSIGTRSFAVSVYGVELDTNHPVALGDFTLIPPNAESLKRAGLPVDQEHLSHHLENLGFEPLIVGHAHGTKAVAEEQFRIKAELLLGLLAVFVGANFENGATGFRIGMRYSAESSQGRSSYLSWSKRDGDATVHYALSQSQRLKINNFEDRLRSDGLFDRAVLAISAQQRSPLEEALVKALYWFCDAQRDAVPVMQFVKYWSCIETFFSATDSVVRSVSSGLATSLVVGGGEFFKTDEYGVLKRRITKLYALRCRAVHSASYRHVTGRDVAELSQWTAWLLIIMTSLLGRGYTTTDEVRAQTERLDSILTNGGAAWRKAAEEA